jgi:hypothetical protein
LIWGTGAFTGTNPDNQSFFASFLFTKKKMLPSAQNHRTGHPMCMLVFRLAHAQQNDGDCGGDQDPDPYEDGVHRFVPPDCWSRPMMSLADRIERV